MVIMTGLVKRPTLEMVLAYKNIEIINGFRRGYAVSQEEAEDIFEQTKRMLWLSQEIKHDNVDRNDAQFLLDDAIMILDEMWHNFILFSKAYYDFCFENFGEILHHKPTVEGGEYLQKMMAMDTEAWRAMRVDQMRAQYKYVYDKLGKECFLRWYVFYKKEYSVEKIMKLKIVAYEKLHGKISWSDQDILAKPCLSAVGG